jgi:hypothetical protein
MSGPKQRESSSDEQKNAQAFSFLEQQIKGVKIEIGVKRHELNALQKELAGLEYEQRESL